MNDINDLLKIKCNYNHDNCKNIAEKINTLHKNGKKIDNVLFTSYLSYLNNSQQYYYEKCVGRREIYIPVIKQILEYLVPKNEDMCILARFPPFIMKPVNHIISSIANRVNGNPDTFVVDPLLEIFSIIIANKVNILPDVLETALVQQNMELSFFLINRINSNSKCLEAACLCPNSHILINLMITQKIKVTEQAVINAIRLKNENIINTLLQVGFTPSNKCLIEACKITHEAIIKKLLLYKLTPTKECFNALLSCASISHNKTKQYGDAPQIAKLIDILIKNGYTLTYNDVYNAMTVGCYINNIKQYNINFDDGQFIEECTRLGYFPYPELDIKPTQKCLYTECKRPGNISNIQKLIAQGGLTPDVECLKQACDNKSNIQNIKLLVEVYQIKPNIDCIKEIAEYINNPTLTYLLDHFVIPEPTNTSGQETDKKPSIKKKTINALTESSEEEIKYTIINLNPNKLKTINKKNKYELTPNAINLLNLDKSVTMTFCEARKFMLSYINRNDLSDKKRKDLIKLDTILCKLLTIKKGKYPKYINFDDIDNVTCTILKV